MLQLKNSNLLTKLALFGSISILSIINAHAQVTLQVDDNIKVTAINGKAVNTSLFQPIKKTFTLTPGEHVVTAKYDRIYDLPGDDFDYLKSDNITVSAQLQDNQTYHLTMPGQPEKYKEARKYVNNPTLALKNSNQIIAQETATHDDTGLFSSIGSLLGGNKATEQNQQVIAAIEAQPSTSSGTTLQSVNTSTSQTSQGGYTQPLDSQSSVHQNTNATTLDRFMQIWLQATPAERVKIRQWVQQ